MFWFFVSTIPIGLSFFLIVRKWQRDKAKKQLNNIVIKKDDLLKYSDLL